jgi:hypothetical protein
LLFVLAALPLVFAAVFLFIQGALGW